MLEKKKMLDQIEVKVNGVIFIKEINQIVEDGVVISSTPHRTSVCPQDDVSGHEHQLVRDVAALVWTDECKAKYLAMQEQQIANQKARLNGNV